MATKNLTNGDDFFTNNAGFDRINALSGDDEVFGQNSNRAERVYGDNGNDLIEGRGGDDKLYGNSDSDTLKGEGGDDLLEGGSGFDDLFGGRGSDVVKGGSSGDSIYGGVGADTLTGGTGGDWFVFFNSDAKTGSGEDVITDFTSGLDRIDLSNTDTTYAGSQTFSPGVGQWSYAQQGGDWYVTWQTASGFHDVNLGNNSVAFDDVWA